MSFRLERLMLLKFKFMVPRREGREGGREGGRVVRECHFLIFLRKDLVLGLVHHILQTGEVDVVEVQMHGCCCCF